MQVFDFYIPSHLKFGLDCVNRIGNIATEYGNKVMLVTEDTLKETRIIERVKTLLTERGCDVIVFDDVVPNATSEVASRGVELAKTCYCDVVIGLGGVRTLSIAKCIAALATNELELWDCMDGTPISHSAIPYIEIPTTPRNPFMFRDEFLITDSRTREVKIITIPADSTKQIIYDPTLTSDMPGNFLMSTMVDTLSNAIEGYLSSNSNSLSDMFFIKAIELIGKNISVVMKEPEDVEARAMLSLAGLATSIGLSMSNTGIVSAISYVLSSEYKIHKSFTSCVVLPFVMDFNITSSPNKMVRISKAFGEDISTLTVVEAAIKAVECVRKLIVELGLPTKLEEFGLSKDELIKVADHARKMNLFHYLPRTCTNEELYAILQAAY